MKNTTVVILAVAVALLAALALHDAAAARRARVALATAVDERDALRERLAKIEQEQQTLAVENASLRAGPQPVPAGANAAGGPQFKAFTRAIPRGRMPGPMEAFDSPEMRQLMAIEQKGRLDGRYAALFKALHLPPEKLDGFKQLLVDKQNAAMDVFAVAHKQNLLDPTSGADVPAIMKHEQEVIDAAIRGLIGETAYEEYQDYERTRPQRGVVDQLASRLSYTDNPLSTQQSEALVDLLAAEKSTQPAPTNVASPEPGVRVAFAVAPGDTMVGFGPMGSSESAPISDASLAGAEPLLSAAQLAALRQLQAEQQAQQQMSELLRRSMPMMPGIGNRRKRDCHVGRDTGNRSRSRPAALVCRTSLSSCPYCQVAHAQTDSDICCRRRCAPIADWCA